jgi:excisionase family DNA binding protein
MASQHLVSTKSIRAQGCSVVLGRSRPSTARLEHLACMTTTTSSETALGPVVTLSQLAIQLGVTVQTLYDLRSQGRGPRGFRVGRELRFRVREVDAWLAQLEADDAERHPRQAD